MIARASVSALAYYLLVIKIKQKANSLAVKNMFLPPPAFSARLPVTRTNVYKPIWCHILKVTKFRPWQAAQGAAFLSWELSAASSLQHPGTGGHRSRRAVGQLPQQGMQGEAAFKIARVQATKGFPVITSYASHAQRQVESRLQAPTCSTWKARHCACGTAQRGHNGLQWPCWRRGFGKRCCARGQAPGKCMRQSRGLPWPQECSLRKGLCQQEWKSAKLWTVFQDGPDHQHPGLTWSCWKATNFELGIHIQKTHTRLRPLHGKLNSSEKNAAWLGMRPLERSGSWSAHWKKPEHSSTPRSRAPLGALPSPTHLKIWRFTPTAKGRASPSY